MRTATPLLALLLVAAAPGAVHAQGQPDPLPSTIWSGFDPRVDGVPFTNLGDVSTWGNCFAMVMMSVDNFNRRMRRGEYAGAPTLIGEQPEQGHYLEQSVAGVTQRNSETNGDNVMGGAAHGNPSVMAEDAGPMLVEALRRIDATGEPEELALETVDQGGHSVNLFGFHKGHLLIYDPNYPGETIAWPFDPATGKLGRHPKTGDSPVYQPDFIGSTPVSKYKVFQDLGRVRAACEAGASECREEAFPEVTASRRTGAQGEESITGRVDYDPSALRSAPDRVWVAVDGKPVTYGFLDHEGKFDIPLARGALPPGSKVQLVTITKDGLFGGVTDLSPDAPVTQQGVPAQGRQRTGTEQGAPGGGSSRGIINALGGE